MEDAAEVLPKEKKELVLVGVEVVSVDCPNWNLGRAKGAAAAGVGADDEVDGC